jgi:hypothetical protein
MLLGAVMRMSNDPWLQVVALALKSHAELKLFLSCSKRPISDARLCYTITGRSKRRLPNGDPIRPTPTRNRSSTRHIWSHFPFIQFFLFRSVRSSSYKAILSVSVHLGLAENHSLLMKYAAFCLDFSTNAPLSLSIGERPPAGPQGGRWEISMTTCEMATTDPSDLPVLCADCQGLFRTTTSTK